MVKTTQGLTMMSCLGVTCGVPSPEGCKARGHPSVRLQCVDEVALVICPGPLRRVACRPGVPDRFIRDVEKLKLFLPGEVLLVCEVVRRDAHVARPVVDKGPSVMDLMKA